MSLRTDIQTQLQAVVGVTSGIGASWQYQTLTSALDVEPRTYGTLTTIVGHQSNRSHGEAYDNGRGTWMRQERCGFRVSDGATELKQGDVLRDPNGIFWAILGIISEGVGTRRYDLVRDVPLMAEAPRAGGV